MTAVLCFSIVCVAGLLDLGLNLRHSNGSAKQSESSVVVNSKTDKQGVTSGSGPATEVSTLPSTTAALSMIEGKLTTERLNESKK